MLFGRVDNETETQVPFPKMGLNVIPPIDQKSHFLNLLEIVARAYLFLSPFVIRISDDRCIFHIVFS